MDSKVTIEEVKNKVKKFCEDRDWTQFHNPKDLAIAISTEAGEMLQHFRFKSNEDVDNLMKSGRRIEIEEELADIFYSVLRFAQMSNIDLSQILSDKMAKSELKYPVEKVKGCNKKYNEYD